MQLMINFKHGTTITYGLNTPFNTQYRWLGLYKLWTLELLNMKRLNNQKVECMQIISTVIPRRMKMHCVGKTLFKKSMETTSVKYYVVRMLRPRAAQLISEYLFRRKHEELIHA